MVQESNLYMLSALVAFFAFVVSMYYCLNNKPKSEYGIYPILILGLIALAKSIEFYEKYTYKLKSNR